MNSSRPRMESSNKEEPQNRDNMLDISDVGAASGRSTPVEPSDASLDYADATTYDPDAKARNLQKSFRTLTRRSSLRSAKGLTRMSSLKYRRPTSRKGPRVGGDLPKKQLKKLRSIKLAGLQSSIPSRRKPGSQCYEPLSLPREVEAPPNYLRSTRCSDVKKVSSQANDFDSESSTGSGAQDGKISNSFSLDDPANSKNETAKAFARASTLKPLRLLSRSVSLKPKRPSARKRAGLPKSSELSIHRATCSSAIKGLKNLDQLEVLLGGGSSNSNSSKNFCPYNYCSLHGHRHGDAPTLRRLKSARKCASTQRSKRLEGQPWQSKKDLSNSEKAIKTRDAAVQTMEDEGNTSDAVDSLEREVVIKCHTLQKTDSNGDESKDGDADVAQSVSLADAEITEMENPHVSSRENLHQACFFSEEQNDPATFLTLLKESCMESCCNASEIESGIHDCTSAEKKEKEGLSSDDREEDALPYITQTTFAAMGQTRPEDEGLSDELSSTSTCSKENCKLESQEKVAVILEVDGKLPSGSGSESHLREAAYNSENTSTSESSIVDEADPVSDTCLMSENSKCDSTGQPCSPNQAKKENLEAQFGEPGSDDACRTPTGRTMYNGLWYLIYQHMVSDITSNGASQTFIQENKQEQMEDGNILPGASGKEVPQGGQDIDNDEDCQQMELCQSDAIKLLQEALNKILLTESPRQLSDGQSMTNDTEPEERYNPENENCSEGVKESSSISTSSKAQNSVVPDTEEKRVGAENADDMGKKAEMNVGKTPNLPISRRWSNVRKLVLLRRFVKALEKTRNFRQRMTRFPSSELHPEVEKVSLRRQSVGDKRKSEEWMLDFALRKVISNLDPDQKRKVALLVKAFETVSPAQGCDGKDTNKENGYSEKIVTRDRSCTDPVQSSQTPREEWKRLPASSIEKEGNPNFSSTGVVVSTPLSEDKNTELDQKEKIAPCIYERNGDIMVQSVQSGKEEDNEGRTNLSEPPKDGKVQEVYGQIIVSSSLALGSSNTGLLSNSPEIENFAPDTCTEFDGSMLAAPQDDVKSAAVTGISSSSYVRDLSKEPTSAGQVNIDEAKRSDGLPDESSQLEDFMPASTEVGVQAQFGNKKSTSMWYLIYKHMRSGLNTEEGNQLALNGPDKQDEEVEDKSDERYMPCSCQDSLAAMPHMSQFQGTDREKMELKKMEAIKLVQEAIDEILLSESEESTPHDQFTIHRTSPDEVAHFKETLKSTSKSGDDESADLEKIEPLRTISDNDVKIQSDSTASQAEDKTGSKVGNKVSQGALKNWNNLKKVILLNRFTKALEKVRKLNSPKPQYLPSELNQEPEMVTLRHQDVDERRNGEEWMLDYALQQVVSRLTPIRRKKVQLLVEAFETVVPPVGH